MGKNFLQDASDKMDELTKQFKEADNQETRDAIMFQANQLFAEILMQLAWLLEQAGGLLWNTSASTAFGIVGKT